MGWYFAFFFLSGFCSILYELVWLRLTMAQLASRRRLSRSRFPCSCWEWARGLGGRQSRVRRRGIKGTPALRLYALAES